jgi:hypothetical protein
MSERKERPMNTTPIHDAAMDAPIDDLDALYEHARRAGFTMVACPSCDGSTATCANCAGTGHLWSTGSGDLDDHGLSRLRQIESRRERGPTTFRRLL